MYRITGLQVYPASSEIEGKDKYHIEISDHEKQKLYCTGYILAEVQNHVFQMYQFSVDLYNEVDEPIVVEDVLTNDKLKSIINAICGILYNNYIDK